MVVRTAEIIASGNELTSGRTLDTNAVFIARELAAIGIPVLRHTCVGDDCSTLASVITEVAARCDVAIITGGLGPTADDVTREALSAAFGRPLIRDPALLEEIVELFHRRGRAMPSSNEKQAMLPRGAEAIHNPTGTAPGVKMTFGRCTFYALPGVPSEMEIMLRESVLPGLGRGESVIVSTTINIFGVPEAAAGEAVAQWMKPGSVPSVGITAEDYILKIGIWTTARNREEGLRVIQPVADIALAKLGQSVFGRDSETLEEVVSRTISEKKLTLSVAESCTGGLVSHRITRIPGASDFFLQGVVAYSNQAKVTRLGVPQELIERHGAVSEEVARAMAEGIRRAAGTSLGVGVTGIAGPAGGTPEKPVGLVYAAVAGRTTRIEKFLLFGNRTQVQDRAAKATLNLLRLYLSS